MTISSVSMELPPARDTTGPESRTHSPCQRRRLALPWIPAAGYLGDRFPGPVNR